MLLSAIIGMSVAIVGGAPLAWAMRRGTRLQAVLLFVATAVLYVAGASVADSGPPSWNGFGPGLLIGTIMCQAMGQLLWGHVRWPSRKQRPNSAMN